MGVFIISEAIIVSAFADLRKYTRRKTKMQIPMKPKECVDLCGKKSDKFRVNGLLVPESPGFCLSTPTNGMRTEWSNILIKLWVNSMRIWRKIKLRYELVS